MNLDWITNNLALIGDLTAAHLWLTLLPTVIGLVLSIPLGYLAFTHRKWYPTIVGGTGLFYTIPSLALFILLPKLLGTQVLNPMNIVVALVIYTVALLTRVVADGLDSVSPDAVQAATGIGFTRAETFFKIQLPIAVPAVMSGLRVVVVSNISIVTMAAVIGIAQLGSLFTMGFTRHLFVPIVVGLVACLLLALVLDRLLVLLGRVMTPWGQKGAL
ncbi:ABC transporter permease subunit [Leucobacter coleopterorum]|uniref:ABC transporter permease subunit n=1 Tax=Leucobacter coleopterorum TaxID=2714933 RepID=A0ABX6JYR5_9MICO|nr:ABC transporter permease subunit [Leucobacter coleopterorum]QIM19066.1 ABC transporter permease subunit [Leucobacter coleopterorum]